MGDFCLERATFAEISRSVTVENLLYAISPYE